MVCQATHWEKWLFIFICNVTSDKNAKLLHCLIFREPYCFSNPPRLVLLCSRRTSKQMSSERSLFALGDNSPQWGWLSIAFQIELLVWISWPYSAPTKGVVAHFPSCPNRRCQVTVWPLVFGSYEIKSDCYWLQRSRQSVLGVLSYSQEVWSSAVRSPRDYKYIM